MYLHCCPSTGSTHGVLLLVDFSLGTSSLGDNTDDDVDFCGCRGAAPKFAAYLGIL